MKIALGLEYPLALRGGVGVLVETLIAGLTPSHEIVLVSPDPANFTHPGVSAHVRWDPPGVTREASRKLAARLAGLGVNLAHFHFGGNYGWGSRIPGQSPFPFLARAGIRCITTIHVAISILDGYCDPAKPLAAKLALFPVAWLGKLDVLRHVRTEVVVSKQACARVRRWYWPLRGRFLALYHSRLPPVPPPQPPQRQPLILSVGHLAFRKGQLTLVQAFAKIAAAHPAWNLALIGHTAEADCRAQIEKTIAASELGSRVRLLGSREDAVAFMQRAGVVVQPSLFEGLPLALQESMFYGCPCIASRVTGNDELVQDGQTGLLVPPADPVALAQALDRLLQNPAQRETLGRAAAAFIIQQEMTAEKMVERHSALYQSA